MSATFLTLNVFCQKKLFRRLCHSIIYKMAWQMKTNSKNNHQSESAIRIQILVNKLADKSGFGFPALVPTLVIKKLRH